MYELSWMIISAGCTMIVLVVGTVLAAVVMAFVRRRRDDGQ